MTNTKNRLPCSQQSLNISEIEFKTERLANRLPDSFWQKWVVLMHYMVNSQNLKSRPLSSNSLNSSSVFRLVLLVSVALSLSACSTFFGYNSRGGASSSLVDYLYPDGEKPPKHEETKPHLMLPVKVGLAFVPSNQFGRSALPEAKKQELLESVKARFVNLEYVDDITIVPETYMAGSTGFRGLNQLARLYDLDVVALVSYDQVSVTSERKSSLLYWTIVGAYVIRGNQNLASTFVDTAVFDVRSKKLLFRAPGVSEVKKSSTLVEVDTAHREIGMRGFEVAMASMTDNLELELELFRERIKETDSVQVSHRKGYGGGGATGIPFLLLLMVLLAIRGSLEHGTTKT